jgi:hypothetical protein
MARAPEAHIGFGLVCDILLESATRPHPDAGAAVFILEEPYVSDLLATTVGELGLPVLDTPTARARLVGGAAERRS